MVRKREDTAEGCREMATDDRARAADVVSDHMRHRLERSADAWTNRANLLERLQTSFNARVKVRPPEQQQEVEGKEHG
jgi:hypothetical protein